MNEGPPPSPSSPVDIKQNSPKFAQYLEQLKNITPKRDSKGQRLILYINGPWESFISKFTVFHIPIFPEVSEVARFRCFPYFVCAVTKRNSTALTSREPVVGLASVYAEGRSTTLRCMCFELLGEGQQKRMDV